MSRNEVQSFNEFAPHYFHYITQAHAGTVITLKITKTNLVHFQVLDFSMWLRSLNHGAGGINIFICPGISDISYHCHRPAIVHYVLADTLVVWLRVANRVDLPRDYIYIQ